MNEPIDVLVELLRKWSIKNVISIDDGWLTDYDQSEESIFRLLLENNLDITQRCLEETSKFEDPSAIDLAIAATDEDEFKTIYNEISPLDRNELNRIILSTSSSSTSEFNAGEESLSVLAGVLQQLIDKGFTVRSASQYNSSLREGLEGKSLWLLDREIRGDSTQVFNTLELVVQNEDVALIVTNDDSSLSSRGQISSFVEENLQKYKNLATSFLWVLRKDKIDSELIFSVKNVLQGVTLHNTIEIYNKLNRLAESETDRFLRFLEPDDLDGFFRSSFSEGSRLSDTLLRIRRAVSLKSFHEIISSDPNYIENLLNNRELLEKIQSPSEIGVREDEESTALVAATSNCVFSEITQDNKVIPIHSYEQWDYNVNLLGSCVYTGDLFVKTNYQRKQSKWEKSKVVYLLITQPCDTVLRKTNGLVQRGTKNANLIKGNFLEYGTSAYRKVADKEYPNKLKVHFVKLNNKYGMIEFDLKNIHQIDFRILDLCSLDPNGEALLRDENLDRTRFMSTISKKYYFNEINEFVTKLKRIDNQQVEKQFKKFQNDSITLEELKNLINKEIQKVSIKNNIIIPNEIEFVHNEGFSLTRTVRLNDEFILNVIKQSTEYQGRQALPGLML
ncbi:hypothetical protein NDS46_26225 [Paenibacillus thiaminolyticus]|uniref:hypothetical protein n=1 Tax=Paenibacillus thiaminolyticus TaxID=49283 RepID=UPI002330BF75|nr:hypothetical protein [Paenibacillus thiaminolyticus]WCF07756.1 hypothetical protein NDS46_26225 [Paenibacillus thiaminolyticus]